MSREINTQIDFHEIEDKINDAMIYVSESVCKFFNLTQQDMIRDNGGLDPLLLKTAKFAVQQAKLKFPAVTDESNPIVTGLETKNVFSMEFPKEKETLVVTACTFQGKKSLFMLIWNEIDNQAHDGQNVKRPRRR